MSARIPSELTAIELAPEPSSLAGEYDSTEDWYRRDLEEVF
jgi:hypothetical protein